MKAKITREQILARIYYDPETGIFTWKEKPNPKNERMIKVWNSHYSGKRAGTVGCNRPGQFRRLINIDRHPYKEHQLAWVIMKGEWPTHEIDHRDLNGTNNIWDNLRAATGTQNKGNRRGTSKIGMPKGVQPISSGKYFAQIKIHGKNSYLGTFDSK
jgi:hypothetical protein